MKKLLLLLFPALLASCMAKESNNENPRGVYKMTKLIGKTGEIDAPFDQYQICTDSITMLAWMENDGRLYINGTYKDVLNYTGDTPKDSTDKSILIYNSNARGFALKWWSDYNNHIYFPKGDWCTELYEANLYSADAEPFFNILMNAQNPDGDPNSYLGTWRLAQSYIQIDDETVYSKNGSEKSSIDNILKQLQSDKDYLMKALTDSTDSKPTFISYGTTEMLGFSATSSDRGHVSISNIKHNKDNTYTANGRIFKVVWLSENCIALVFTLPEIKNNLSLLVRENPQTTLISQIADYYIHK